VGNLSFFTTEEQIFELFSKAALIKRIIMGLDRNSKTPCGFCFVELSSPIETNRSQPYYLTFCLSLSTRSPMKNYITQVLSARRCIGLFEIHIRHKAG
jgi:hypothetical protein